MNLKINKLNPESDTCVNEGTVGILVVSGGSESRVNEWLGLCLQRITRHTRGIDYRIYVWNNNVDDKTVPGIVGAYANTILIQANSKEKLKHVHAVPLQRLYEKARDEGAKYIVTMDTDAFPICDEWLRFLIEKLNQKTVLSGIWRDELKKGIKPYIHPSCLCTTVAFIEQFQLRLDDVDVDPKLGKKHDTLTHFSELAIRQKLHFFKLTRSNKNQVHYLMGGIYGDLVYHQGAASRTGGVLFWGEKRNNVTLRKNNKSIKNMLIQWTLEQEESLFSWLRGENRLHHLPAPAGSAKIYVTGSPDIAVNFLLRCFRRIGFKDVNQVPAEILRHIHEKIPLIAVYAHPQWILKNRGEKRKFHPQHPVNSWEPCATQLVRLQKHFKYPLIQFNPLFPDLFLDTVYQLSIELGKNPDIKHLSVLKKKWPGAHMKRGNIPASSQAILHCLERDEYGIRKNSFAYQLVKLKKNANNHH